MIAIQDNTVKKSLASKDVQALYLDLIHQRALAAIMEASSCRKVIVLNNVEHPPSHWISLRILQASLQKSVAFHCISAQSGTYIRALMVAQHTTHCATDKGI